MLNTYLLKVQRLLHDPAYQFWGQADLVSYINEARQQVAMEGQCIRVLPRTSGPITTITIKNAGAGYTAPLVAILGQGSGATATATQAAGVITGITVSAGGDGYFPQSTNVVITDPTGTGAQAVANIPNALATALNQEVYNFTQFNSLVQQAPSGLAGGGQGGGPGVLQIHGVDSVSISWGQGMKPTVFRFDWSSFQAYLRAYSIGLMGYPSYASQYGQGVNGSIALWPVPSGVYIMDWDTFCIPINLLSDGDPEAIPYPWTDAVPSYAAHLAFENSRQVDNADRQLKKYQWYMQRAGTFSRFGVVPDYYVNA